MKILAVMGSPKGRGSGFRIVEMIADKMKAVGDVKFSYLFLKEVDLKFCTGCYVCMARGEDKCPLHDDRADIEQKLLSADGIILSSPLYVDNVSGLMKNFIDRFAYSMHRPQFFHQKVLIVINSSSGEKKEALMALKKALGGSQFVCDIGISTPPWPQTEEAVAKKERAIEAAARKFYKACLNTSLPSPTLQSYTNFLLWKKLSLECRQFLPKDYEFYNAKAYYYETAVNLFKAAAAKIIARIMINGYLRKGMGPGSVPWPVRF